MAEHELLGPHLLWTEVTSAIHEAVWRREIDVAQAQQLRETFDELSVDRRAPDRLHDLAWQLADELGLAKTYDAEFLALARIEGCH
ncbi:MAG: type II toxin-antitoxin system VapC family toxin [Nitriliruptorales bacterium]